jgi:flagellar hook-associated protein 2
MGSPITLSGFNSIDFNLILNTIMQQERQPVVALETQKKALEAQKSTFGTLASKLGALESAVEDLLRPGALDATRATVSDTSRLSVSSGASAVTGTHEIVVDQLARAQVTTSTTTYADKDTTKVAAGTLRFTTSAGAVDVALSGDVTLQGLADAINAQTASPVVASIVRTAAGRYQLMLTGRDTGQSNTFTVDRGQLTAPSTGGNRMSFTTAQAAQDASIRINGVVSTSSTNVFDGVIGGVTFTATQADPNVPVVLTITADQDSVINLVKKVTTAFNEASAFLTGQTSAAAGGDSESIGRDPLVRGLRSRLANVLTRSYATGAAYGALAEVGFEFTRSGELTVNEATLRQALTDKRLDVAKVFGGADGTGGAFGALLSETEDYTKAGGLVPNAQNRLSDQLTKLSDRIADMEERLAIKRAALQREFAAADQTIAQLNSQKNSLSSLGSQYSLF